MAAADCYVRWFYDRGAPEVTGSGEERRLARRGPARPLMFQRPAGPREIGC
jgi:hypothetical protein